MPRYFFDLEVNGTPTPDLAGRELDDRAAALKLANAWIMGVGRGRDRARDLQCHCIVRNDQGDEIYHQALVIPAVTHEELQAVERQKERRAAARAARLAAQGTRMPRPV